MPDEIDQKMKVGQNTWFFLRFFSPAHFDHWRLSYHGDHGTSVSDEIDQEMEVGQNTWFDQKKKLIRTLRFFLYFFPQLILTTGS